MAGPKTKFYRDKANGKVSGVCAGLADYFGVDVTIIRIVALTLAVVTGVGIPLYFIAAWITPVKKGGAAQLYENDPETKKFWQGVRKNPRRAARTVRARFREYDRRLANVEAFLTSPDRRLAREIDSLR